MFRAVAVWLATLAVFAGLAGLGAPAAHADTGSEEALFLSLTNSLRSSLGIQTLTPQSQLTSIAALFLTTEAVIADKPEEKGAAPAMPGGGMEDF